MITGFKKQTKELTTKEMALVPLVVNILETRKGKKQAITNRKIIKILKNIGYRTTPPRIRKIIRHIRINGSIKKLIATSKGYYVSTKKSELDDYIQSLYQRSNSIQLIAQKLNSQR